jgi:hypothetical protein
LRGPPGRGGGYHRGGGGGGQLDGRAAHRFAGGNDGTPDRALVRFVVRAAPGTTVTVTARHDRAGRCSAEHALG